MFCNNQRLVNAFTKAGFAPTQIRGGQTTESMRRHGVKDEANLTNADRHSDSFRVTSGDKVVTWHLQDGKAVCVHCGHLSQPSDSMTDYFPGSFARTIKAAVEFING